MKGGGKNYRNTQHWNVKFIVAAELQSPLPPAGGMEAEELITHLGEREREAEGDV